MTTFAMNSWLETALEQVRNSNPKDGELLVSEPIVCGSAAGYYLGCVCIEWSDDIKEWIPQPYYRQSLYYKTEQEAERALAALEI